MGAMVGQSGGLRKAGAELTYVMDYILIALGGFLFGIYIQTLKDRVPRPPRKATRTETVDRQVRAFLRGMEAFEKGVATQLQRDRRAERLRQLARRTRIS